MIVILIVKDYLLYFSIVKVINDACKITIQNIPLKENVMKRMKKFEDWDINTYNDGSLSPLSPSRAVFFGAFTNNIFYMTTCYLICDVLSYVSDNGDVHEHRDRQAFLGFTVHLLTKKKWEYYMNFSTLFL